MAITTSNSINVNARHGPGLMYWFVDGFVFIFRNSLFFGPSPSLEAIADRGERRFLSSVHFLMPMTAAVRGLPGATTHTSDCNHCQVFMLHVSRHKTAAQTKTGASAIARDTRAARGIINGISPRSTGFFKKTRARCSRFPGGRWRQTKVSLRQMSLVTEPEE